MTAPLLEVTTLSKTYRVRGGEHTAVADVSFTLPERGALALVGESGAGKTTVARIIAGMERATSGTFMLGGTVQLVHQDPYSSLDPRQRIGAGLRELTKIHRNPATAEELLGRVGLRPEVAAARPARLSGGQRQRVAIARALAVAPHLLILDEAVAALDVSVQAQILNLLADIRDQTETALLFVTHDLAVARQVCDEVLVMRRGRAVEAGPIDRVLTAPAQDYTRTLLDSIPRPGWVPTRSSQ